jgi:hypothetical protein
VLHIMSALMIHSGISNRFLLLTVHRMFIGLELLKWARWFISSEELSRRGELCLVVKTVGLHL